MTLTCPQRPPAGDLPLNAPTAQYLRMLAVGLRGTHALTDEQIADYPAGCPGAAGQWTRERVLNALNG